jgi:hypothetical protein
MATNSTTAGAFGFQGLPEGTYFVKAHKLGYNDVQSSTEVKAGDNDPPLLKVSLVTDRTFVKPFYTVMSQKGFIQCGVTSPVVGVALCAAPNNACLPLVVLQPCLAHGPNVTQDAFSNYFAIDGPPNWLQCELVWENTQSLGTALRVITRVSDPTNYKQNFYLRGMNSSSGQSPLLVIDDYDMIHDAKNNGKTILGNNTGLEIDVFSGNAPTPAGAYAGVQVNQDYKIIAHVFYGFRPPVGWRFTSDGDPPLPE